MEQTPCAKSDIKHLNQRSVEWQYWSDPSSGEYQKSMIVSISNNLTMLYYSRKQPDV